MPLEAQLAPFSKIASVIYIIAAILVIQSANESQKPQDPNQNNISTPNAPTPVELVSIASKLYLLGNIIFFILSSERLKQAKQEAQAGDENTSITPDLYVTTGWIISILGSLFRVKGHNMKVRQAQNEVS